MSDPVIVRHPPNLNASEEEPGAWGVDHIDGNGNRWSVCDCGHATAGDALACANATLTHNGRTAFETYNHAVGGFTWNGLPISGWDAVTEHVRDGWRMAAFAAQVRQVLL